MEKLAYTEIEAVIGLLFEFINGNKNIVVQHREHIERARALEASVKTKNEFKTGTYNPNEHSPSRLAVFLLNYYGEHVFDNRQITIKHDDLTTTGKATHTNTYILHLKDADTHEFLYPGNPTGKDEPYDYTAEFIKQITNYADGNINNTTRTAWDSFNDCYKKPVRKFDFKSALWKNNDALHNANYSISIKADGTFSVHDTCGNKKSGNLSIATQEQHNFYDKYLKLLSQIYLLNNYTWDDFLGK